MHDRPAEAARPMTLSSPAARAARALHGRKAGRGFVARCPVHDDRTPSLSLDDGADGRLLVKCFAGCNSLDVLAELRRLGLAGGDRRPVRVRSARAGRKSWRRRRVPEPSARCARVSCMSCGAPHGPMAGTLAERYLIGRDLDPGIADPAALKFLPGNDRYPPAMLALVSDIRDAAATLGLQITSLNADGTRQRRVFLRGSRPRGGVVRLIEDAEVATELGLARKSRRRWPS